MDGALLEQGYKFVPQHIKDIKKQKDKLAVYHILSRDLFSSSCPSSLDDSPDADNS